MNDRDCHDSLAESGSNASVAGRRRWLLGCGSAVLASVAGCLGDADDGGSDDPSEANGDETTEDDEAEASAYDYVGETEMAWPRTLTGAYGSYVPEAEGAMTDFDRVDLEHVSVDGLEIAYAHFDGHVYAQGEETVAKYDPDGMPEWDRTEAFQGGPYVDDDGVYCLTDRDQVVALDDEEGERSWIRPAPDGWELDTIGTPEQRYDDGILYMVEGRGYGDGCEIGAYDVESEEFVWVDESPYRNLTIDLFGDRLVLTEYDDSMGGSYSGVRVFDTETGAEQWTAEVGVTAESVIANESTLYAGGSPTGKRGYYVAGFDLENGDRRFEHEPETEGNGLAADDRHLYYGVGDGYAAFDAETGAHEWTYQMVDSLQPGVVVTDDAIYLPTDRRLYVVDPDSGDQLAEYDVDIDNLESLYGLSLSGDRLWGIAERGYRSDSLVAFEPAD